MRKRLHLNLLAVSISVWLSLAASPAVAGQPAPFRIDYTVAVASTADRLFHVTADIKNIREPQLQLSLPTWTPGWYTVENYYKNVLRFKITGERGEAVPFVMTRKQTWRVETAGRSSLKVEFDYRADVLALNQAKITDDYAFFTGTQLFLEAKDHRNQPSNVRIEVPAGWKIVSALKETADPATFTAPDYDTLVDSPTEMGNFDMTRFEVAGKPHFLVTTPANAFSKENAERYTKMLASIFEAQSKIFGGFPYEKYVCFYFFARPESNAGGALEHNNSFVAFARAEFGATPDSLMGTASHEFFHLWNVKRIRPAEMWPYDYSRENETPLLWVSEGMTSYYGALSLLRAGLHDRQWFLGQMEGTISGVEGNEARGYISPANSSRSTWVGYDTPVAFGISYYTQGMNLGALLDISILNDTKAAAGLDAVMNTLYRDYYQKGKGFTTDDLIAVINRITGRDYREFFKRYVWGVEVPPYETIYAHAGYLAEKGTQKSPNLGMMFDFTPEGLKVERVFADENAAKAGIEAGDILLSLDDIDLQKDARKAFERLQQRVDQTVKLGIKRGSQTRVVELLVASESVAAYKIKEAPQPTPAQLKVREAWLKVTK